jgi:hypothetical protein
VVIAGANVPDFKLLEATLDAVVIERPRPSQNSAPQHLCLDEGYDKGPPLEEAVESREYIFHTRRIGEEKLDEAGEKRYPARRWVVERTLGWLSKCRAILIRYEKKALNYLKFIKVACILLWYRRQHRLALLRKLLSAFPRIWLRDLLYGDPVLPKGLPRRLPARGDAHLGVDVGQVALYGRLGEVQSGGYLDVG